jgi:hypothetical protein
VGEAPGWLDFFPAAVGVHRDIPGGRAAAIGGETPVAGTDGVSLEPDAPPEAQTRYQMAKEALDTVLGANEHEDSKAGRILGAIAFLTAAAAAIFAKGYGVTATPVQQAALARDLSRYLHGVALQRAQIALNSDFRTPPYSFLGVDLTLLFFALFMLFVLVGVVLYLAALGPSFKPFSTARPANRVRSMLYFNEIAPVTRDRWETYWNQSPEDLARLATEQRVYETWLVARKTADKVNFMSLGSILFRLAVASLLLLLGTLFTGRWQAASAFASLGGLAVFAAAGFEVYQRMVTRTSEDKGKRSRNLIVTWVTLTVTCVVAATVFVTLLVQTH